MKTYIKNIFNKYIGNIEYIVTIVNVSLLVEKRVFSNIKEVDEFVKLVNLEAYWDVQKIEKIRRFSFAYNKEIVHSPLHFCVEDVTEMRNCDNYDYSFLKKHESLLNVNHVSRKI